MCVRQMESLSLEVNDENFETPHGDSDDRLNASW